MVLDLHRYQERLAQHRISECVWGKAGYEGGYFDLKYVSKPWLEAALTRASEPTRHSFIGNRVVWSRDPAIASLCAAIPAYQIAEQAEKIRTFHAALVLNAGYFWGEVRKRPNDYWSIQVTSSVVYYGFRLVLAHNQRLFPCQKWLAQAVSSCGNAPVGIVELGQELSRTQSDAHKDRFVDAITAHYSLVVDDFDRLLTRFIIDQEQWWMFERPPLEW